jgi:AcrR family transcriptional regulator
MRKNASDVSLPGGSARFAKKRQLIVDAATQIINDKGVAGLTFAEVADLVGLSTSSATYYFRLKEQLAAAAFENTLNRIETLVANAAREPDPLSRVSKYVHMYFEMHGEIHRGGEQPIAILSEMRALDDAVRVPLAKQYSAIFRRIREFFGSPESERHRAINTARAQHLTEADVLAACLAI